MKMYEAKSASQSLNHGTIIGNQINLEARAMKMRKAVVVNFLRLLHPPRWLKIVHLAKVEKYQNLEIVASQG